MSMVHQINEFISAGNFTKTFPRRKLNAKYTVDRNQNTVKTS